MLHLDEAVQTAVYVLIIKYWSVFHDRGVFVPVCNYKCMIHTGNTPPIAVKKIMYGLNKVPITRKAIAALEKVGHIRQILDGR